MAPAILIGAAALALPGLAQAQTAPPSAEAAAQPFIPAATRATSPFKANRLASEPTGLRPNGGAPLTYPTTPIVLTWAHVPGAVEYRVQVSGNPGFSNIVWQGTTDQDRVAPEALLPDGPYWWRVRATDAAGTVGRFSRVARFVKSWPSGVAGHVASATPGGGGVSQLLLNPYLRWNAVPGAKEYDVEVTAADQFGTPAFFAEHLHAPFTSPAVVGAIPDDSYVWRVRARDPNDNPGPWSNGPSFTRRWTAPTVVAPADSATTEDVRLRWNPVEGAESYQVQVSDRIHVWTGDALKIGATTSSTSLTPSLAEEKSKEMGIGPLWWRVRPVINGRFGSWSTVRALTWAAPSSTTATPTLSSTGDSTSALMPQLEWTPVTGASLYRVDIAADPAFNNLVESQLTSSTSWTSRTPLPDNQVGSGYHWRVIWGAGSTADDPQWMVAEASAPTSTFRKQTQVTPINGQLGQIGAPPLLRWNHVSGIARFEVELSKDERFGSETRKTVIWGTGFIPGSAQGDKSLPDGTWYWRVRGVDGGSVGQTWSPVGSFTLTAGRPAISEPRDGQVVVGAPTLRWSPVDHACGYQVQIDRDPGFPTDGEDEEPTLSTAQTAAVPSGEVVNGLGRWYWRVRANLCDDVVGQWSPARSFRSVRPPQFNLNMIPGKVSYKRRVIVSGRLVHNGRGVARARLRLQRLVFPQRAYRGHGTVRTDRRGRFRFRLTMRRSASYRLVWRGNARHPEGIAPFAITVTPRVALRVNRTRVERRGVVRVAGTVFPRRRARLQIRTSDGWRTLRSVKPRRARFSMGVRVNVEPGKHRLRLLVSGDRRRKLATASSRKRSLLVFDRFVVRGKG
ncbi:MAG: hypothetical protein ACR2N6_07890 [Miltoncostaeaceae bacterium]